MLKRAIFGAIYVAVIICGILCGSFVFLLLSLLLTALAVNEFLVMTQSEPANATEATVAMLVRSLDCVGAAILSITAWTGMFFLPGVIFIPGAATFILYLIMRLTIQLWLPGSNPLRSVSTSMMSQLYVALPIALMSVVYRLSPHLLLLFFILVWVNDTFAYLTGRAIGRHKLCERISPKKTREGFAGGLVATIIVAVACGLLFSNYFLGFGAGRMAVVGAVVCIAATLGDLVESQLKRAVGVKDSGTLIPGHGGILDRIDSILLVIPVSLILLFFMF